MRAFEAHRPDRPGCDRGAIAARVPAVQARAGVTIAVFVCSVKVGNFKAGPDQKDWTRKATRAVGIAASRVTFRMI